MRNLRTSYSILAVALALVLISSVCSAQILVSTTMDKENFYENEVGMLTIKVANDYPEEVENVTLRIECSEGIMVVDNFEEKSVIIKETGKIRSGGSKEVFVKLKVVSLAEAKPTVFVYYGKDDLQNASVTYVSAVDSPVSVKTNARRVNSPEGEKIIVGFKLVNYSSTPLSEVVAEAIAPENYLIRTPPLVMNNVGDRNVAEEQFELVPPPEASGVQNIVLSYGYIDDKGAHYFEENFEVNIERTNQLVLAVIGIVVLIIAGYLYMLKSRSEKEKAVKGTAEKAEEEEKK